jgi:hypothetical protein
MSAVAGRIFVSLGLLMFAVSLAIPHLHVLEGAKPNAIDFIRGLLIGIGVAFEIAGISGLLNARKRKTEAAPR